MGYTNNQVTSSIGAKSISNSEIKLMEVSLKSYVKDIFDRIDRNQQSSSMKISNIEKLASKISIQLAQLGAENLKTRKKVGIGVETQKLNGETLVSGGKNCGYYDKLGKNEVAHKVFDEMPKKNLGVVHKVFDEMSKESVNSNRAEYAKSEGVCIGGRCVVDYLSELKELKQIASVKEYHDCFIDVLSRLQLPEKYSLGCFIDGLKEDILCMVMLFKPQTIHEAYCLAKLQEATLEARKPKEPTGTASSPTQNILKEGYPDELRRTVDIHARNTDSQAFMQSDAKSTIQLEDIGEAENGKDAENLGLENVEEQNDELAQVKNELAPKIFNVLVGVTDNQIMNIRRNLGGSTREMLWNTGWVQYNCPFLETKDKYEQKYASVSDKLVGINGIEKTSIGMELLTSKDERPKKPSSNFIVSETFGWKPGLKSCSFERWRKIQHGLNEHGVVHMLMTRSLMLRAELHLKCDYESLKWHHLGRMFKSSRRLQGVIDAQHQSTIETTKARMVEKGWDASDLKEIEKIDLKCSCSIIFKESIRLVLILIGRSVIKLHLLEFFGFSNISSDMKVSGFLSFSNSKNPLEPSVVIYLPSLLTLSKLTNVELMSSKLQGALFIDKGNPYIQVEKHNKSAPVGPLMQWDKIDLENLLLALENIDIKEWMEQFETKYSGEASVADDSLTFKIYKASVLSMLVAPIQFATTRVIYNDSGGRHIILPEVNRSTKVVKWLVKWKWKSMVTIHGHDPWGQGSFEGEGIVMCLTRVWGPECHFSLNKLKVAATIEIMEDGISLLPDCSLVEILSRLDSTKEVIRTCILSKRWEHLWIQVPVLNFTIDRYTKDVDQITEFISYVMIQRGQSRLNKFVLSMPYYIRNESIVSEIIRSAVTCNVQDLDLSFNPYDLRFPKPEFVLDDFFFVNSSFNHLRLDGCSFSNATGVVSWSNLKSLYIADGKSDEDLVKNILSGSPLLENLELVYCFGFGRIHITSPSVKKLVIKGYKEHDCIVEIYAPHISSLTIKGNLRSSKVVLLDVSSLVEAKLDHWATGRSSKEEKEEMLKGHILSLRHVKKLKFGHNSLETLARLEAKGFTFPSNIKYPDTTHNED